MKSRDGGVTIIELLIVASILSILAAIALPNMASAQTRAKVARANADLRVLCMAIEVYYVDNNSCPRMVSARFYADPTVDFPGGKSVNGIMSRCLSTPIAYVTNTHLGDPFTAGDDAIPFDEQFYTYHDLNAYVTHSTSDFWPKVRDFYGLYRVGSVGPDRTYDHGFANSAQLPYDPSNGVVSLGNIWRSHRGPPAQVPPVPALLARH